MAPCGRAADFGSGGPCLRVMEYGSERLVWCGVCAYASSVTRSHVLDGRYLYFWLPESLTMQ